MHLSLLFVSAAHAGSLDRLDVGGAYGTPTGTNPAATWWNPAALGAGRGHRLLLDVAPTLGGITAARDNPDYGALDPAQFPNDGFPTEYDYSGTDRLGFVGVLPFLGVASDLGVDGLGLGLSLAVPHALGGALDDPNGANRFANRQASLIHVYTSLAAAYQVADKVSFGVAGHLVNSQAKIDTDTTILPDLAVGVRDILGDDEVSPQYQDGLAETPGYGTTTIFDLKGVGFTFGGGVHITPLDDEQLAISLSYNHGLRVQNKGSLDYQFECPPAYDEQSNAAVAELGTCNTAALGEGTLGYRLPSRIHLGVAVSPVQRLRLELMGAAVFWSAYRDLEITTSVSPDEFDVPRINAQEAAKLATQDRLWARDGRDTFWVGLDAKGAISDLITVGGRVTYDRAAIQTQAVSANNYDASGVILAGLLDVTPAAPVSLSLSFAHTVLAPRTVTDSPFGVSVEQDAFAPRYSYPSNNGTYTGSIDRLALSVRVRLGAASDDD